jgi:hypothetical protein
LLLANSNGATVAAHMALGTNTACTGFAANTGATAPTGPPDNPACVATPEPNSLVLLLASGLFGGLVFVGRRLTV